MAGFGTKMELSGPGGKNYAPIKGQTQIINGSAYEQYSPQWYEAMDAEKLRQAGNAGTAAGTAAGSALKALNGLQPGATNPSTSSSSSSSSGSQAGAGQFPRVGFPGAGGGGGIVGHTEEGGGLTPAGQTFNLGGSGAAANLPPPIAFQGADFSAAEQAAFARAKDKVGETTQGALTGLRSALGSRGLLGSGLEGKQTARIFTEGQGQLGDVARGQAIDAANQAQKNAELQYSGGITQRGQNLTAQQAANALAAQLQMADYSGQITQRGQDISAANAAASNSLAQQAANQSMIDRILNSLGSYLY